MTHIHLIDGAEHDNPWSCKGLEALIGIPWPVAFGGTSENLQRTLQKLLEPQRAGSIRPALLVDSLLLHRIHHCLPCTDGQPIAPLQEPAYNAPKGLQSNGPTT
jgi:hypothetical protein